MGTYTDLLTLKPKKPIPAPSPEGQENVESSDTLPATTETISVFSATTPDSSNVRPPVSMSQPLPDQSQNARNLASQKTRKPDSPLAGKRASQKSGLPESQKMELERFMTAMLSAKAPTKTSYRYPQELLDRLAEAEWELRRTKGKKVHMNTIVVVALAYLLWEHQKRGEHSLLVTLT